MQLTSLSSFAVLGILIAKIATVIVAVAGVLSRNTSFRGIAHNLIRRAGFWRKTRFSADVFIRP